jgi:hypothetical protein
MIGTLGSITGGSGYVNGTYTNVPFTGGSGTLGTANFTVSGGAVTSIVVLNPGKNFVVGDTLSASNANLGGAGSGFSVPVASTSVNSSLAGGSVNMYQPGNTTPKNTWKDSGQVTLNTNPIILDANGCAVIYGLGQYRQQLLDSLGNLIFDQLTTDTSAQNSPFYAGLAGGSPNGITITDTGFNSTDGSIINFIALSTNTGATTLNPSSSGAIPIRKATSSGLVALAAGDIIATNPVSVIYFASGNQFVLLNTTIQSAAASQAPLCGATHLKLSVSSATQAVLTADTVVMTSSGGLTQTRSSVNQTLIITNGTSTSAANGMDGETPGTNTWLDVFAIDNGAAPAVLGSLASGNGLAPVMPAGYTFKCYVGAIFSTGAAQLQGSQQNGNRAQWVVGGAGITNAGALNIANGTAGTFSLTSPVLASLSIASWVPPTASSAVVALTPDWKGNSANVLLAPNTSWGGTNNGPHGSNGATWPCWASSAQVLSMTCTLLLETAQTLAWTSSGSGGAVSALGWTDAVNAN